MAKYIVGYDLNKQGQNYDSLIKAIKTYHWWHCLDSTWVITSPNTAKQIRDHLQQFIDSNDELLVAALTGEAAWTGFDKQCSDWLMANL